ncbi:hypothetical protein [Campylobacter curvus]|uniref:hypothetical protein n=1 Tax=Campylobacter curvus TaxID=200 RepID=UPI00146FD223|nr:hypothetical protein [Campylobacter curvus]
MIDLIGNVKKGSVAWQVQIKTGKTLRRFCRENDLSYGSIASKKCYSKRALAVFKRFGIKAA